MSSAHMLTKPVRRYFQERLERLYDALSHLGQRLRESIASVVGEHAGDIIRETVHAVLENRLPEAKQRLPSYREPTYRRNFRDDLEEDRYGARDNPGLWYDEPEEYDPPDPSPTHRPKTRWWSLLPTALQALVWWMKNQPSRIGRIPVRTVLGIGAASGLAAVVIGPLAGILTAITGSALFLTHLADGVRDAVGGLIHAKTS